MAKLRVRAVAEGKGLNLNKLYRAINSARHASGREWVALGTVRRYWHSTKDGALKSEGLDQISWSFLQELATIIDCSVFELLPEDDGLGNQNPVSLEPYAKAA